MSKMLTGTYFTGLRPKPLVCFVVLNGPVRHALNLGFTSTDIAFFNKKIYVPLAYHYVYICLTYNLAFCLILTRVGFWTFKKTFYAIST